MKLSKISVIFSGEAEKRRVKAAQELRARLPRTWELLKTTSEAEATRFARDHGWAQKKVQVRALRINTEEWEYYVEPFEKDCGCPNILKFEDYFDRDED